MCYCICARHRRLRLINTTARRCGLMRRGAKVIFHPVVHRWMCALLTWPEFLSALVNRKPIDPQLCDIARCDRSKPEYLDQHFCLRLVSRQEALDSLRIHTVSVSLSGPHAQTQDVHILFTCIVSSCSSGQRLRCMRPALETVSSLLLSGAVPCPFDRPGWGANWVITLSLFTTRCNSVFPALVVQ